MINRAQGVRRTGTGARKREVVPIRHFLSGRRFAFIGKTLVLLLLFPLSLVTHASEAPALPQAGGNTFSTGPEQVENESAVIDVSNTGRGYMLCRYTGKAGQAVVVVGRSDDDKAYRQSVENNGEYAAIPFLYGDGLYSIQVLEQAYGMDYYMVAGTEAYVTLDDETLPFLYPNRVVPIKPGSLAVTKAHALTRNAKTDPEIISAIYNYIVDNIVYDHQKAVAVGPGYASDPDETIRVKKGICVDYTVLAATMLRSQGIPTKVENGYMADGAYHSWISVCSDRDGMINGLFELKEKEWTTLDPTYAAGDEARVAAMLLSAEENGDYITFYVY